MPFCKCEYSGRALDDAARVSLMEAISNATAGNFGKSEDVMFVQLEHTPNLMFGRSTEPCAFVHIEGIGGTLADVCDPVAAVVVERTGIPENRIFFNFRCVEAENWGLGGKTIAERRAAAAK
jgi:phenylpyruvate tautomerase PptA (4-oxalocrotonate tautomerase family)